jgi:DNA-binding response OmpR family regulator
MKVLVVEDAPRLANTIARGLRNQGIAVDIAYDGHEAARRLQLYPYDVVLLDRDLPGIHGDALCRMITESEKPAMILMLTAAAAPDERVRGLALGADDYLPKPFHFPELVLPVRALARRASTAQGRILRAGDIEFDPSTGTVIRSGCTVTLTARERGVLEALLKANPGGLSAEQLLEQCGTRTPTRSRIRSGSRSAGSAVSSASPRSFRRSPASATASRPRAHSSASIGDDSGPRHLHFHFHLLLLDARGHERCPPPMPARSRMRVLDPRVRTHLLIARRRAAARSTTSPSCICRGRPLDVTARRRWSSLRANRDPSGLSASGECSAATGIVANQAINTRSTLGS